MSLKPLRLTPSILLLAFGFQQIAEASPVSFQSLPLFDVSSDSSNAAIPELLKPEAVGVSDKIASPFLAGGKLIAGIGLLATGNPMGVKLYRGDSASGFLNQYKRGSRPYL